MTAAQTCEWPVTAGHREMSPSNFSGHKSTASASIPKVPAIAHMGRDGTHCVVVLQCCYCTDRHWHGGNNGPKPDFSMRVAHCRTKPGLKQYVPTPVNVARWAIALGIDEAALREAIDQLKTLNGIDRRYGLRKGTAAAELIKAMEVSP